MGQNRFLTLASIIAMNASAQLEQKCLKDTFSENVSNGSGKEILAGWNIEMQRVQENKLQITVVAKQNSWVGLILGGHDIMDADNDLIVVSANGK